MKHVSRLLYIPLLALVIGCAGAKVRYDAAPSPIDENYHTVLLEADCGDGVHNPGFGQVGCSWAPTEKPHGSLTIHTPLPGTISLYSRTCGVDLRDFHAEEGGSFSYDFSDLMPYGISSCVVEVYVTWQLPPKMTTEYPLRGMTGRVYLRQRPGMSEAVLIAPERTVPGSGVSWMQFRESAAKSSEATKVILQVPKAVKNGSFRLAGCGLGVQSAPFNGTSVSVSRETLLGDSPKKGRCVMFGHVKGLHEDGSIADYDAMFGVEVFGVTTQKLSASVLVQSGKVCYEAENSVTAAILHYGNTNKGSNKLKDCFDLPAEDSRLGFFTHQGRATYAIIEAGAIKETLQ